MHIKKVEVKNFRLLRDVQLLFEKRTTLIVGRNNSGKTSLTEIFRRVLSEKTPSFALEDFSLGIHEQFWTAYELHRGKAEEVEIRNALPVIELKVTVEYDANEGNLGPLTDFIIDLNPACFEATFIVRYQPKDGILRDFLSDILSPEEAQSAEPRIAFFRALRERIPKFYASFTAAIDPNDATNEKPIQWAEVQRLMHAGFINAQRGLDDVTHRDQAVLGKILESLFRTASSELADEKDRELASRLQIAVREIQKGIDAGFNKQLQDLLPAFGMFGYRGLGDSKLTTETTLEVERLLTDHTRVFYPGVNGVNLPEAYNGLGTRNLIFILLKLLEYFKSYLAQEAAPRIHIIFIEEPEVHLHPQMQEVFIGKINDIARVFSDAYSKSTVWPVQFVVTTHSSHLANKAPFDAMRYFITSTAPASSNQRTTRIKDLRQGLDGTPQPTRAFLHKYMTLTRCDLLFADKAVLIEGPTERILFPCMLIEVDKAQPDGRKLTSQYLSIVEVGGAYAHLFLDLLNFLELKTLIITDIDAINHTDGNKACTVSTGTRTSNSCIKAWFDSTVSPAALIAKTDAERVKELQRIAYQIPERTGAPCGRSFEAAFVLANPNLFGIQTLPTNELEARAWDEAQSVTKKSDFALRFAVDETDWTVPEYIAQGLRWLADDVPGQGAAVAPPIPAAAQTPTPAPTPLASARPKPEPPKG